MPQHAAKNDEGDGKVRYSNPMKTPPATPEFKAFSAALRDILKVKPEEMKTRIGAHKERGKRLSKGSASLSAASSSRLRSAVSKP